MTKWPPTASSLAAARGALSGAVVVAAAGEAAGLELKVGGMIIKSESGGVKMEGEGCLSMQQQQQQQEHSGAINQQLTYGGRGQERASDSQFQA